MADIRTVRTASGPIAVQIVCSSRRGSRSIEHLGSAHDDGELEALTAVARQRLAAGQGEADVDAALYPTFNRRLPIYATDSWRRGLAATPRPRPCPPVITAVMAARRLAGVTVVADGDMISEASQHAIEDAGLSFIWGTGIPEEPYAVQRCRREHPGQDSPDGQVFTEPSPATGAHKAPRGYRRSLWKPGFLGKAN